MLQRLHLSRLGQLKLSCLQLPLSRVDLLRLLRRRVAVHPQALSSRSPASAIPATSPSGQRLTLRAQRRLATGFIASLVKPPEPRREATTDPDRLMTADLEYYDKLEPSESLFSVAGHIQTELRTRMEPATLDSLNFLKYNYSF